MKRALLVLFCLLPVFAQAHRFAPSLLEIDQVAAEDYRVRWKTPVAQVSSTALRPVLPAGCEVTAESPWFPEGTGKYRQFGLRCSAGLVAQTIGVSGLAENQGSVLLTLNFRDGISHQAVLNAETPAFTVPAEPNEWQVVSRYTVLGAEHIWAGIDHLLFVLGLLLLVKGGRRLVLTITAFTLGHSVTLAMVTLGLFDYPVALIEFLIALSIFVLAIELTRPAGQSALWRRPWWLAGGFGLLHGMGFAGALADTGLPQANVPLALLFFNLGIELGQLAFIALLLALGYLLSARVAARAAAVQHIPVLVLGVLSAYWCIERGLEALG